MKIEYLIGWIAGNGLILTALLAYLGAVIILERRAIRKRNAASAARAADRARLRSEAIEAYEREGAA